MPPTVVRPAKSPQGSTHNKLLRGLAVCRSDQNFAVHNIELSRPAERSQVATAFTIPTPHYKPRVKGSASTTCCTAPLAYREGMSVVGEVWHRDWGEPCFGLFGLAEIGVLRQLLSLRGTSHTARFVHLERCQAPPLDDLATLRAVQALWIGFLLWTVFLRQSLTITT